MPEDDLMSEADHHRSIHVDPTQPTPFDLLRAALSEAKVHYKRQEWNEAIHCFSRALELNPPHPTDLIVQRGTCYLKLAKTLKAIEDADSVLQKDKTNYKALVLKGDALFLAGSFEFALMYYHRGNKLRPDMNEFRLGIQNSQIAIANSIDQAEIDAAMGPTRSHQKPPLSSRSTATPRRTPRPASARPHQPPYQPPTVNLTLTESSPTATTVPPINLNLLHNGFKDSPIGSGGSGGGSGFRAAAMLRPHSASSASTRGSVSSRMSVASSRPMSVGGMSSVRSTVNPEKHLLGKLYDDKKFLKELADDKLMGRSIVGAANGLTSLITDGLSYLNHRQEFWRQQEPNSENPEISSARSAALHHYTPPVSSDRPISAISDLVPITPRSARPISAKRSKSVEPAAISSRMGKSLSSTAVQPVPPPGGKDAGKRRPTTAGSKKSINPTTAPLAAAAAAQPPVDNASQQQQQQPQFALDLSLILDGKDGFGRAVFSPSEAGSRRPSNSGATPKIGISSETHHVQLQLSESNPRPDVSKRTVQPTPPSPSTSRRPRAPPALPSPKTRPRRPKAATSAPKSSTKQTAVAAVRDSDPPPLPSPGRMAAQLMASIEVVNKHPPSGPQGDSSNAFQQTQTKKAVETLRNISNALQDRRFDEALTSAHSLLESLSTIEFEDKPKILANTFSLVGTSYFELGKLDLALANHKKDLEICLERDFLDCYIRALHNSAITYERLGDWTNAIKMWEKKLQYTQDPTEMALIWEKMGQDHLNDSNYHSALHYLNQVLNSVTTTLNLSHKLSVLTSVGRAMLGAGGMLVARAVGVFEDCVKIAKELNDPDAEMSALNELSEARKRASGAGGVIPHRPPIVVALSAAESVESVSF